MSSQRLAFVDVETTGSSPIGARVTEVAVVHAQRDPAGGWQRCGEWSSLVNPGVPIPPEIQFLTGITPAMVAQAPSFVELADQLLPQLTGRGTVFVAHHARFDYGFLKAEFARCGLSFGARTLCTVRLSKLLDPDRTPHSLDALIARHRLPVQDRHRALGDARVLWDYLDAMMQRRGADTVEQAMRLLLKQPSLPAHLPADTLKQVPRGAGVYLFYGLNAHPLYIGKSRHLRNRVASHFVADWRSERGVRLASETRRIEWQETAGDLGAQLLEQRLIREQLPAHNVALRRRERLMFVAPIVAEACGDDAPVLRFVRAAALGPRDMAGHYGPFASRAAVHRLLTDAAAAHGLCLRVLGIERGVAGSPCFNRQLGRCAGCCVGVQGAADHARRVAEVLAARAVPAWPWEGAVAIVERSSPGAANTSSALAVAAEDEALSVDLDDGDDDDAAVEGTGPGDVRCAASDSPREDWHVFAWWCHLGTAADEHGARLLAQSVPPVFETAAYRLLRGALAAEGGADVRPLIDR